MSAAVLMITGSNLDASSFLLPGSEAMDVASVLDVPASTANMLFIFDNMGWPT